MQLEKKKKKRKKKSTNCRLAAHFVVSVFRRPPSPFHRWRTECRGCGGAAAADVGNSIKALAAPLEGSASRTLAAWPPLTEKRSEFPPSHRPATWRWNRRRLPSSSESHCSPQNTETLLICQKQRRNKHNNALIFAVVLLQNANLLILSQAHLI